MKTEKDEKGEEIFQGYRSEIQIVPVFAVGKEGRLEVKKVNSHSDASQQAK